MNETREEISNLNQDSVAISDQWLSQLRYVRINRKDESNQDESVQPEVVFVTIPDVASIHKAHRHPQAPNFLLKQKAGLSTDNARSEITRDENLIAANATPNDVDQADDSEAGEVPPGRNKPISVPSPIQDKANSDLAELELTGPPPLQNTSREPTVGPESSTSKPTLGRQIENDPTHSKSINVFSFANVESNPAIELLVNKIVADFPVSAATLMFVGAEDNSICDSVCAKVAGSIAARKLGRVLLVDANVRRPRLTIHEAQNEKKGFTDLWNSKETARVKPERTQIDNLDFLPRGLTNYSMVDASSEKRSTAVKHFRKAYRFTCVNAGQYTDAVAQQWGTNCDATYLLLSLDDTDQIAAIDAVESLREYGARISGAIATKNAA